MTAPVLAMVIAFAVSLGAQPTPERPWNQSSAFAGAQVCRGCHPQIYEKQEASAHAKSLRPPAEIAELTAGLPFQLADRASGATLTIRRTPEGVVELMAKKDGAVEAMTLDWAFGSGTKGITPVGRRATGEFTESRLTWYASLRRYDFTTGAAKFNPTTLGDSLGRPLRQQDVLECFGCHSTGGLPKEGGPARAGMGIHCERCHGPGQEHARVMATAAAPKEKQIFHPGRLDGFEQAQMCGACHGRPPEDSDLRTIQFIQQSPNTARFPSERLVLSRCFNESPGGLRCTGCHDPHADGASGLRGRDAVCGSCHRAGLAARAKVCRVGSRGCASCHMPKEQVMAHSLFTDHWIRIVRKD